MVSVQNRARLEASKKFKGRFGRYKAESERAVREATVKEDNVLPVFKEIWRGHEFVTPSEDCRPTNILCQKKGTDSYSTFELDYNAKDIERLSLALAEFQGEKHFPSRTGLFLSALINCCDDKRFTIHTSHLSPPPACLGTLLKKGKKYLETELWNGEYFYQKIETDGLDAEFKPLDVSANGPGYADIVDMLNTQGPKYQYGIGCLSDGVLGFWMARM